ncbi:gas vesicle protein GvpG [Halovivax gelatinilyticus]|uniref:gas vesicle protein GvpG n=1 Tax=Halovivax gelatinilyticus TaxID=2961597 RepID=UPI0020CA5B69|nr:protein gvpG [Halovivax gelatinilyticus]
MIVVDDLLFRPIVGVANALRAAALDELYDVEAIQDEIAENRLLYELGERSDEEYERTREELEAELDVALEVREWLSGGRVEVKA